MITILMYITGLLLSIIGLFFIFININLLLIGYSFWQYIQFILTNIECLLFFIGILLLITIYERG